MLNAYYHKIQQKEVAIRWYNPFPKELKGGSQISTQLGTNREWRQKVGEIEKLYKDNNLKAFHATVNKLCKMKTSCPVV